MEKSKNVSHKSFNTIFNMICNHYKLKDSDSIKYTNLKLIDYKLESIKIQYDSNNSSLESFLYLEKILNDLADNEFCVDIVKFKYFVKWNETETETYINVKIFLKNFTD